MGDEMKYGVAYGNAERAMVSADDSDTTTSTAVPPGQLGTVVGRAPLSRRRRQVLRIAHVVGLTNRDWREGRVDAAAVNNVERMLYSRIERRRAGLLVKRLFDVLGSAFALVLLAPLLSLTALAVWLTTPGPVIYSQLRYGRYGRPFRVYKFRTLYADRCDPSGVVQTVPGDQRITPVGRLIRRTNIDELPQLWNVLIGDMSLVGPRPHALGMHGGGTKYEDLVLAYSLRTMVKPGITGLAQVRGYRGPTIDPTRARMRIVCDLIYIAECSNLLDIKILFQTVLRELRGGTGA